MPDGRPQVWQIACGDKGRRYERLFLDHDIMLLGPGRFGQYDALRYEEGAASRECSTAKLGYVRSFASEAQPGDLVLARSGYIVVALGVVSGHYQHEPMFDDVYGWDLNHCRRVVWQPQMELELQARQARGALFAARKQVPSFTRVSDDSVLSPIRDLFDRTVQRSLKPLPPPIPAPMSDDALASALFSKGLGYDAAQRVVQTLRKLRDLLNWYSREVAPDRPTEHEVVAHIILPLMIALGWSEQLLAVEWKKIDLAVFWGTPTDADHCQLVCEAKGRGSGLEGVVEQAIEYCRMHSLDKCARILVADGGRFYLYRREGSDWLSHPSGYINLQKVRRRHLLPAGADAVETLMALTPAHLGR